MSARDSKRYYWWKCNHEFFNGTKMLRLRKTQPFDFDSMNVFDKSMISSLAIECIYIKLLSESCTHKGKLRFSDDKPYTDEAISEILETPQDFWMMAKKRLIDLDMMKVEDDGTIVMTELPSYIQSETNSAARIRTYRSDGVEKQDESIDGGGVHCTPGGVHCTPEDVHRTQDIRYKILDNRNNNKNSTNKKNNIINILQDQTKEAVCSSDSSSLNYPLDTLIKECESIMAIRPDHKRQFAEYVFRNGICEKDGQKISRIKNYLSAVYRTWTANKLYDEANLKPVSMDEAKKAMNELNKNRATKISEDEFTRFWNFIVGESFKRKDGSLITKYNIMSVMSRFVDSAERIYGQGEKNMIKYSNGVSEAKPGISQELNNKLLSESEDD